MAEVFLPTKSGRAQKWWRDTQTLRACSTSEWRYLPVIRLFVNGDLGPCARRAWSGRISRISQTALLPSHSSHHILARPIHLWGVDRRERLPVRLASKYEMCPSTIVNDPLSLLDSRQRLKLTRFELQLLRSSDNHSSTPVVQSLAGNPIDIAVCPGT